MKSISLLILSIAVFSVQLAAQTNEPANDWKSATSNQGGKEYPQVNSEGRVKFRIVAPKAESVGVSFRGSSQFTKGDDGAWTGYTLFRHSTRIPARQIGARMNGGPRGI